MLSHIILETGEGIVMNIIGFLRFLYGHTQIFSLRELSFLTGLSDRTIRTFVAQINEQEDQLGCHVKLIRTIGYRLIVTYPKVFSSKVLLEMDHSINSLEHDILQELVHYQYIKVEEICAKYYVSKGTVNKVIKNLKNRLEVYQLQILSRPYQGLYLSGSETLIRKFLLDTQLYDGDVFVYKNILDHLFDKLNIRVNSGMSYYINFFIVLMIKRRKYVDHLTNLDSTTLSNYAIGISRKICEEIEALYDASENEVYHIALSLEIGVLEPEESEAPEVNEKLYAYNERLKEGYGLDLTFEEEMFPVFAQHIVALKKRIFHHFQFMNLGYEYYAIDLAFAYEIAINLVKWFELEKSIHYEEIGLLALYVNLLLEKQQPLRLGKRRKVAIAIPRDDVTSHMFASMFRKNTDMDIVEVFKFDEKEKIVAFNPEIIFTFEPFELHPYLVSIHPLPIFQTCQQGFRKSVPMHMEENSLLTFKKQRDLLEGMITFFHEDVFFVRKKFKSKKQILEFLNKQVVDMGIYEKENGWISKRMEMAPVSKNNRMSVICPIDSFSTYSRIVYLSLEEGVELDLGESSNIVVFVAYKDYQDKLQMLALIKTLFSNTKQVIDFYEQNTFDEVLNYIQNY